MICLCAHACMHACMSQHYLPSLNFELNQQIIRKNEQLKGNASCAITTQITQAIPLKNGYSRIKLMFWKGYKCCKKV